MIALGLGAAIGLAVGIEAHDLDLTYDYGLLRCLMCFSIGHLSAFARILGINVRIGATATERECLILIVIVVGWIMTTGKSTILIMPVLFAIMIAVSRLKQSDLPAFESGGVSGPGAAVLFDLPLHGLVLHIFTEVVTLAESKLNVTLWQTLPHGGRMVPTVVLDHPVLGLAALGLYLGIVVALVPDVPLCRDSGVQCLQ